MRDIYHRLLHFNVWARERTLIRSVQYRRKREKTEDNYECRKLNHEQGPEIHSKDEL